MENATLKSSLADAVEALRGRLGGKALAPQAKRQAVIKTAGSL